MFATIPMSKDCRIPEILPFKFRLRQLPEKSLYPVTVVKTGRHLRFGSSEAFAPLPVGWQSLVTLLWQP
jgi:hypothetical protein